MANVPTIKADYSFKFITIGESGVGKSSIVMRYCQEKFDNLLSTIGIDFQIKIIRKKDKVIKLMVWDTAGQERFKTITSSYVRGATAVIFVFDCCNQVSFEQISSWLRLVKKSNPTQEFIPLLIANKIDLGDSVRQVSKASGKALADSLSMGYFEVSAMTGEGIEEAFNFLIEKVYQQYSPELADNIIEISNETTEESCCSIM